MTPARFPDGTELRAAAEVRAVGGRRLEGYASLFRTPTPIGSFFEVVLPGAFRASLLRPASDVVAIVDHNPAHLLARQSSSTLRLAEDSRGLHFALDVPRTTLGFDVLELAERGDLGGASIGFRALDEAWPAADRRELRAVELLEISIIHCWPAQSQTSVTARGRHQGPSAVARARALALI